LGVLPFSTGVLELRTGNPEAAEREFREGFELLHGMGERARAPSLAAMLAAALVDQGRIDEADQYIEVAREMVAEKDPTGQAAIRMTAARVHAHRGQFGNAIRLAAEAVEHMEETEELLNVPDILVWQSEVLELAGRTAEAKEALLKAADAAARKGALVDERRARERLAALQGGHV
jgi:ATP/maltotriose-dependent transcriptional regulator MalT